MLLFGPYAAAAGRREVVVAVRGEPTAATIIDRIGEQHPALAPLLPGSRLAVNSGFAPDTQRIGAGDEVALIGLVSGG